MRCSLRVTVFASVFGLLLGYALLNIVLSLYVGTYYFPQINYSGNLLVIPLVVLVIMAISVVSSMLACLNLRKMDPARIFSNNTIDDQKELPKWISRLKTGLFVKLSICASYRNRKRVSLSVLCGMACLILTFTSLSIIVSKNESLRYIFKERYKYDLGFCCAGSDTMDKISEIDGVEKTERIMKGSYEYNNESVAITAISDNSEMIKIMSVDGKTLSVPDDGIILEEGYARDHNLQEGDLQTINGIALRVTAIAREYHN